MEIKKPDRPKPEITNFKEEEEPWYDDYADEDELCGEWFSPGTEECEFCTHAESCRELTWEAMKRA